MYFSCNVSFSSLPVFLPTILKDMGFTAINAQGLTAPPYFVSFLLTILSTWIADRLQQRGLVIIFLSIVGAVGYVLLAVCTSVGVRYFGVFLAACGVFPCIGNILPWTLSKFILRQYFIATVPGINGVDFVVSDNQGSDSRRGMGIVLLNLIGQCGPFLGTNIFPESEGPRYIRGQWICAAFMFFTTLLAFCLRQLLDWENKRLDREYAGSPERSVEKPGELAVAEENYGLTFRYAL